MLTLIQALKRGAQDVPENKRIYAFPSDYAEVQQLEWIANTDLTLAGKKEHFPYRVTNSDGRSRTGMLTALRFSSNVPDIRRYLDAKMREAMMNVTLLDVELGKSRMVVLLPADLGEISIL